MWNLTIIVVSFFAAFTPLAWFKSSKATTQGGTARTVAHTSGATVAAWTEIASNIKMRGKMISDFEIYILKLKGFKVSANKT